ncbi:MAG TPA: hypothetical protein VJ999_08410, partial [Candidatus Sulfotelmatobacter sp.]|nr:hypothetical protein [Candidatus Sulfotelmatobacter sp.]
AHNPKVGGSNPPPATNLNDSQRLAGSRRQARFVSGKEVGPLYNSSGEVASEEIEGRFEKSFAEPAAGSR